MAMSVIKFVFLFTIAISWAQKDKLTSPVDFLRGKKTSMLEMKEIKATFNNELLSKFKESLSIEEEMEASVEDTTKKTAMDKCTETNRINREDTSAVKDTQTEGNNSKITPLIDLPIDLNLNLHSVSYVNTTEESKENDYDSSAPSSLGKPMESWISQSFPIGSSLTGSTVGSVIGLLSAKTAANATSSPVLTMLEASFDTFFPESSSQGSASSSVSRSTKLQGNNNDFSNILNVTPDININWNILSEITHLLLGSDESQPVHNESNPNEICFDIPLNQSDNTITDEFNKISSTVNVTSKKAKIKIPNGASQKLFTTTLISPTSTPKPAKPDAVIKPTSNDICFNVLENQPSSIDSGLNNEISNMANAETNINLGLSLLSNIQETTPSAQIMINQICMPRSASRPPRTISAVVVSPHEPQEPLCYRRTCNK